MRAAFALSLALSAVACKSESPAAPAAPETASAPSAPAPATAPAADPGKVALEKANAAALALGKSLKSRMTEVLGASGPVAAAETCATEAQALTAKQFADGVRVGRASKKLRNEANSAPSWVGEWLAANDGKPAKDAAPVAELVEAGGRTFARVVKPIAVEGTCLTCHGAPESIAPAVRAVLSKHYPSDAATGYAEGDLRGALWAEAAVVP